MRYNDIVSPLSILDTSGRAADARGREQAKTGTQKFTSSRNTSPSLNAIH